MAFLVAELALDRRTAPGSVPLLATGVARTGERAFNAGIGAVSLVVADLAAVETFAGKTTTLSFVRAIASEVSGLFAAKVQVSTLIRA